ncbi:MAG: ASPIC/UnbV domain-containing protein, partial [Bacteroidota bacterium]
TFSNVARSAGVSQTDWSWAPLLADLDNDGLRDIYITNGLRKDVLNLDFINFTSSEFTQHTQSDGTLPREYFMQLLEAMPSHRLQNAAYKNLGSFQFEEKNQHWGLDQVSFSNGAAFADLDLDGDLDLVVNNLDHNAFVLQNHATETSNNWLRIKLNGPKENPFGIGAKVFVETATENQFQQLFTSRGFQSSVEPILHFGLDTENTVNVRIEWSDGKVSLLNDINTNQVLTVEHSDAIDSPTPSASQADQLFQEQNLSSSLADFLRQNDKSFESFNKEFLLPHELSGEGPAVASADLNNDGLID